MNTTIFDERGRFEGAVSEVRFVRGVDGVEQAKFVGTGDVRMCDAREWIVRLPGWCWWCVHVYTDWTFIHREYPFHEA